MQVYTTRSIIGSVRYLLTHNIFVEISKIYLKAITQACYNIYEFES